MSHRGRTRKSKIKVKEDGTREQDPLARIPHWLDSSATDLGREAIPGEQVRMPSGKVRIAPRYKIWRVLG